MLAPRALRTPLAAGLVALACATAEPFEGVPLEAGQSRRYPVPYDRLVLAARGVVTGLEFTGGDPQRPDPDTAIIVGTRQKGGGEEEDVRLTVRRAGGGAGTVNCLVRGRPRGAPPDDRTVVYCPLILYQFELFLGL